MDKNDEAVENVCKQFHDANDKIKSLESEVSELKQALSGRTVSCSQCNEAGKEIDRLKSEVEALRGLLDGFAQMFRALPEEFQDKEMYSPKRIVIAIEDYKELLTTHPVKE